MPKINPDTGWDDNSKAMGHEARYKGFPKESNPFHPEIQSIEHISWQAGWDRENEILLGVPDQEGTSEEPEQ